MRTRVSFVLYEDLEKLNKLVKDYFRKEYEVVEDEEAELYINIINKFYKTEIIEDLIKGTFEEDDLQIIEDLSVEIVEE